MQGASLRLHAHELAGRRANSCHEMQGGAWVITIPGSGLVGSPGWVGSGLFWDGNQRRAGPLRFALATLQAGARTPCVVGATQRSAPELFPAYRAPWAPPLWELGSRCQAGEKR